MKCAVARCIKRIHGEIPPPCIRFPVGMKGNGRMPPMGLRIGPQGRHLIAGSGRNDGHGAMVETGRNGSQARSLSTRDHILGPQGGGKVHIANGFAQKGVPHATANGPCLALICKCIENRAKSGRFEPALIRQMGGGVGQSFSFQSCVPAHSIRPGTRTPSRNCEGV